MKIRQTRTGHNTNRFTYKNLAHGKTRDAYTTGTYFFNIDLVDNEEETKTITVQLSREELEKALHNMKEMEARQEEQVKQYYIGNNA
jgi:hypothetical protein